MDLVFGQLRDFVGVYMDDVLIFSNTLEEHVKHLRIVYQKLAEELLYANPEKCTFAQPEVAYCGFIVGGNGVRAQPEKLAVIHAWPQPKEQVDVRSFLGLCGFYQRFVTNYAQVAAPLNDLLKKNIVWLWTTEAERSFQQLKRQLLSAPVLIVPDSTKPYFLHSDASEVAIGATLSQLDDKGHMRLVTCRSRKLLPAERNYPVHEKEMLALIDPLKHWRHYLLGAQIKFRTDNTALKYLQKSSKPSARQIRWLEVLQDYTLEIEHIAGRENVAADALSRLAVLANLELPDVQWERLPVAFFPLAPRSPVTSWWPDYLTDQDIRDHYFITGTDQLIDPLKFHHGRL